MGDGPTSPQLSGGGVPAHHHVADFFGVGDEPKPGQHRMGAHEHKPSILSSAISTDPQNAGAPGQIKYGKLH